MFALASSQRLTVVTDGGVDLHAGPSGEVAVTPDASGSAVVSHWHTAGAQAELDLSCPTDPPSGGRACAETVALSVPTGTAVTVQARNAGVTATGLSGPLNLATVNGDVAVVADGGASTGEPVQLTTRNGSIHASGLRAPTLSAFTVNGDVDLGWAVAPGQVTAETTNGSIDLTMPAAAPSYALSAGTQHGGVNLGVPSDPGSSNRLTLNTVNGSVTVGTNA